MSKAQALAAVTSRVGCAVERVLFFGDSRADLHAARSAGARFVGVTREKIDFTGDEVPTIFGFEDREALALSLNATATTVAT
jgi:phosphoglycolate phosphatase-like HAD superfamily hydrolase